MVVCVKIRTVLTESLKKVKSDCVQPLVRFGKNL